MVHSYFKLFHINYILIFTFVFLLTTDLIMNLINNSAFLKNNLFKLIFYVYYYY